MAWKPTWIITKYENEEAARRDEPYEVAYSEGNIVVDVGFEHMWKCIRDDAVTPYSSTYAYIWVGDGTAAEAENQTALQGTNTKRKGMVSGYPKALSGSGHISCWKATFGSADANFAWEEFAIINDSAAGVMLNRQVDSQGTKQSGQVWSVEVQISMF